MKQKERHYLFTSYKYNNMYNIYIHIMSLRNRTINNIIKTNKYYTDTIEYPEYIQPWTIVPAFTYIKDRQLEEKSLTYNPVYAGKRVDNIYNYKTNEPLHDSIALNAFNRPFGSLRLQRFPSINIKQCRSRDNHSIIEHFNTNNNDLSIIIIICLIMLIIKIV